jgi:hypothetical protein
MRFDSIMKVSCVLNACSIFSIVDLTKRDGAVEQLSCLLCLYIIFLSYGVTYLLLRCCQTGSKQT